MRYILFFIISFQYLFADVHIFAYHRFGDTKYKSTNVNIDKLRKQFDYLKKNNYKVVPLSDIYTKLDNNETIPNKWVALTIDDAYKSFYQNGLKVFKEYDYPFTLFVYVEAVDRKYGDFMKWKEIKETAKYGEIALHSYRHPKLQKLTTKKIKEDTEKAINLFEKNLGFKAKYYCYPYGEYNDRVKNIIKNYNFLMIFNQNNGVITNDSDIYDLDRIALTGKVNIASKLKLKKLDAEFIEPKNYPKNKLLTDIKIKLPNYKNKTIRLYVSDFGWKNIKVKNGILNYPINFKLQRYRVRIILKDGNKIATKIIVKE